MASKLEKIKIQLNAIFDSLKELSQIEKNEALLLIQTFYNHLVNVMLNNCNISPPNSSCNVLLNDNLSTVYTDDISTFHFSTSSIQNDKLSSENSQKQSKEQENLIYEPKRTDKLLESKSLSNDKDFNNQEENVNYKSTNNNNTDEIFISREMKELLESCDIVIVDSPSSSKSVIIKNNEQFLKTNNTLRNKYTKNVCAFRTINMQNAKKIKKKAVMHFMLHCHRNCDSYTNQNFKHTNYKCTSCYFCKKSFNCVEDLRLHFCSVLTREENNTSDKIPRYKCVLCRFTFHRLIHLQRHSECHLRNLCKLCNRCFTQQSSLSKHIKIVHKIMLSQKDNCLFCTKTFAKKKSLYRHLNNHAKNQYACTKCGKFFELEDAYLKHINTHVNQNQFFCKNCNLFFQEKQQYDKHLLNHKQHLCTNCNINFPNQKLWIKHHFQVHNISVEERKHLCTLCGKTFLRPMHLRLHMSTHSNEKIARCFQCSKSFRTERTLAVHLKTHGHLKRVMSQEGKSLEIEKPFSCALCESKFFRKQTLTRHMEQIHNGKTPLQCPHCSYQTSCEANFKRHTMLHTGIKPYVCEICGASFKAMGTLNEHHAYVHSEKRSFLCNMCAKSFKSKSGLQRHMRIHSDLRPYKCNQCDNSYKRMSHLKRHCLSIHKILVKSVISPVSKVIKPINSSKESPVLPAKIVPLNSSKETSSLKTNMALTNNFSANQNASSPYLLATIEDNYMIQSPGEIKTDFMQNQFNSFNVIKMNLSPEKTLNQLVKEPSLENEHFNLKNDLNNSCSFYPITHDPPGFSNTLPVSSFLINADFSTHLHDAELGNEIDTTKHLFGDNSTALLDVSHFQPSLQLCENKGLSLAHEIDPLWSMSQTKDAESSITSSDTLLITTSTDVSPSKVCNSMQESSNYFSNSFKRNLF